MHGHVLAVRAYVESAVEHNQDAQARLLVATAFWTSVRQAVLASDPTAAGKIDTVVRCAGIDFRAAYSTPRHLCTCTHDTAPDEPAEAMLILSDASALEERLIELITDLFEGKRAPPPIAPPAQRSFPFYAQTYGMGTLYISTLTPAAKAQASHNCAHFLDLLLNQADHRLVDAVLGPAVKRVVEKQIALALKGQINYQN